MKYIAACMVAMGFAASAQALSVANLDKVPHAVVFESTPGSKIVRTIDPGAEINVMQTGGEVYIEGRPHRLRPDANDLLVIWTDGNLQIQKRRKIGGAGIF